MSEPNISQIGAEQILEVRMLASGYENFECVECAQAIKDYLTAQGIQGQRIKIYTGAGTGPNSYIYDDSVPEDAISENGRHEAITITINAVEMIFDNHHPEGFPRNEWLKNLQFQGKLCYGQQFQIIEEPF